MGLKTRMMCYVMGTLTTGMIICLLLNVSLMMAAFPSWIDDVGMFHLYFSLVPSAHALVLTTGLV